MLIVLSSFLIVFIILGLMNILIDIITGNFNIDEEYNNRFITYLSIKEFEELYETNDNGGLYIKDENKLKKKMEEFDKKMSKHFLIGFIIVIIIFSLTII